MMTNSLFVDTSGWMAFLVAKEIYHARADHELRRATGDPHFAIYTTDHVIAELIALMSGRKVP